MKKSDLKKFKKHKNSTKEHLQENKEPKAVDALLDLRSRLTSKTMKADELKLTFGPEIYKLAFQLKKDDDEWQAFCAHSDWDGESPKPKFQSSPRQNALSFVAKFAVGASSMSSGNRVGMFRRLLKPFWDTETSPNVVAQMIREQQEATKRAAAQKRAQRSAGRLAFNFKPNAITKAINADEDLQSEFAFMAIVKVSAGVGAKREARLLVVSTISVDKIRHLETGPDVPLCKPGEQNLGPRKPPSGGKGKTPPSGGNRKG
jgi:hypothetical protein